MLLEAAQDKDERDSFMVATFQIQRNRNGDNLHLRLMGVFDEAAALSLIEELNRNHTGTCKIFVHTAALDQILDSGVEMFRSSLSSLDGSGAQIIFTGKAGRKIVGEAPGVLFIK